MCSLNMGWISTDVLIIGGGGAGARAALEASNAGCKVVIANKGVFGKSGSTATSHAMAFSAAMGHANQVDSPEEHYKEIIEASYGMCDEKLVRILAEEAPGEILSLDKLGVPFDKKGDRFLQYLGDAAHIARCVSSDIETSLAILRVLESEVRKRDIRVLDGVMVLDLMLDEHGVMGAIALNIEDRSKFLISCRSIVIASGGAGQIYSMNSFTGEMTGDGYAIAYRVGAPLINMEYIQIGPTTVYPKRGFAVSGFLWFLNPRLRNHRGEEFVQDYCPPGIDAIEAIRQKKTTYPFSVRNSSMYVDVAIFKEIIAGRGTERNGIYFDLTHVDAETLNRGFSLPPFEKDTTTAVRKRLLAAGADLTKIPPEIAPLIQSFNGGIRINEHGETAIEGLFAVGESSGGIHGADRLGGNSLADCQVFGRRGGNRAAQYALNKKVPKPSQRALLKAAKQNVPNSSASGKIVPLDLRGIWEEVRTLMSQHASVVRTEYGLSSVFSRLGEIEASILPSLSTSDVDPWRRAELKNMVQVARMVVGSAKLRRESRGTHYREDYPLRDDLNWNKKIVIQNKNNKMTWGTEESKGGK